MDWIKKDLAVGAGASNLVFNEKIKKLRVSNKTRFNVTMMAQ